jgi:hypothetical protein
VAGRHAENQGADTSATGQRPADSHALQPTPTTDPPSRPDAPPPVTAPVTAPDAKPDPKPIDAKGGGPGEDWGTIGETGSLAKDDVQKGMRELAPLLEACWKKTEPGALEFRYQLRVSVRPDGHVKSVEIDEAEGSPPAQVTRCVVDSVKKVSFPRSKRGVTFTYPVQFKTQ